METQNIVFKLTCKKYFVPTKVVLRVNIIYPNKYALPLTDPCPFFCLNMFLMDDYELVPGLSTGNIRVGSRKLS